MVYEVVIVGGGTGGVRAAKILSRWGRDVHITVIDKNHYHIFYSALYEVSTAILPESFSHMPINFFDLKSTAAINFDDIFLDDLNITFLQDEVLGIDFNKREVKLKSSKTNKNYDYLILGIGSETNYFNNTGLLAHSFSLKTVDDALNVRNAIDEAFAKLPKNQIIKVVVGGGGFTGCEFAGEVVGYLKKLSKIHGRPEFYAECLVVEGSSVLLGGAGDYVQKRARGRLEKLGWSKNQI
ncbi:FAD-dependent oxidoreductase [Candidatus Giovannonibacteria bacterium]|nr:FAD-dependent oxidoreductase [Candidatus Giovannonibacteria bacterium]